MTSLDVGLVAPDGESPDRRTAVRMMFSGPERRRRRSEVLPEARHRTHTERCELGRASRAEVPRSLHADLAPEADRPDPLAVLGEGDADRIPALVPVRYSRMLTSQLGFFRGAAAVMAHDLSRTPSTGLLVQLCGDAHLANFGLFATPDGGAVFDLTGFDATLPGPWEWDLKRLAASIEVAGRDGGLPARTRRPLVTRAVAAYRESMAALADRPNLAVWFGGTAAGTQLEEARALAARRRNAAGPGTGWSATVGVTRDPGGPRVALAPPVVLPVDGGPEEVAWVHRQLQAYRRSLPPERRYLLEQYRFVDAARTADGVDAVGRHRYVLLLEGAADDDLLVLQMTEAVPSVLERHLGASAYLNNGERMVIGRRRVQAAADAFLGWQRVDDGPDGATRDFCWGQLRDCLASVDLDGLHPATLGAYAALCGGALARAHARSGDRVAIAAYMGKKPVLDEAIADFAAAYADRNARDLARLAGAAADGAVAVAAASA